MMTFYRQVEQDRPQLGEATTLEEQRVAAVAMAVPQSPLRVFGWTTRQFNKSPRCWHLNNSNSHSRKLTPLNLRQC